MSHLLVYATAESRLHADLVVVRLRRAAIDGDLISVIHPYAARPNSVLCWLNGALTVPLSSGETASVSGLLGLALADPAGNAESSSLVERLGRLGLSREQGLNIEESLLENRIIIAVEVHDEFELPAIFHTFRGLAAEKVHTADLNPRNGKAARRTERYRPAPAHPSPAHAFSIAAA